MYLPAVLEFSWSFFKFIDAVLEVPQLEMDPIMSQTNSTNGPLPVTATLDPTCLST